MPSTIPRLVSYLSLVASIAQASPHFGDAYQLVTNCLTSNKVPFASNSSVNWDYFATDFNLRLVFEPTVITLPKTPEDVSNSVRCAAVARLQVQAKSGGHSYGSYSLGGKNGSLIIDLESFNSISVDNKTNIATVGSGVRLGNLVLGLEAQGGRALPHGSCPGVGVGGHFTHGGRGYTSRLWGMGLDTIVALDVVLADGQYIHATATQHSEIFWAMRGAADSFGIAIYFHLQTKKAPSQIVNFWANIPAVLKNSTTATNAFLQLQETSQDPAFAIPSLSYSMFIDSFGGFNLSGFCIECDLDEFNSVTFPRMMEGFPAPASKRVVSLSYIDSMKSVGNVTDLAIPSYSYDVHDTFYAQSITSKNKIPLVREELMSFFDFIITQGKSATGPWFSYIEMGGGPNSQINVPAANATAYSDRDEFWVILNYGQSDTHTPPFLNSMKTFIHSLSMSLVKFNPQNFGIYLPIVDPELSATEQAMRGYGVETYNKLFRLKKKYDPRFLFWNPQAIGVSPPLTAATK